METRTSVQNRIYAAAIQLFAEHGADEISVSRLAECAGVTRATIYNNVPSVSRLFEQVASNIIVELSQIFTDNFKQVQDPKERLALGIRCFIQRCHEQPNWGRFLVRFAMSDHSFQAMWRGQTKRDLEIGVETGCYRVTKAQLNSVLALIGGSVIASIFLVLEGHKTWRDAGSELAELVLRALGVEELEVKRLAYLDVDLASKNWTVSLN